MSAVKEDLDKTYSRRFDQSLEYRNRVWQVLIRNFFGGYVSENNVVRCGYAQFTDNVSCARRYAMDLNPAARRYLAGDVIFLEQDCAAPWPIPGKATSSNCAALD